MIMTAQNGYSHLSDRQLEMFLSKQIGRLAKTARGLGVSPFGEVIKDWWHGARSPESWKRVVGIYNSTDRTVLSGVEMELYVGFSLLKQYANGAKK